MNYFITGGTGFIGTHLASLLHEVHPETRIYNLDIVEPGTPLPTVKNYKPALGNGEEHAATFIYCDVRQPIELEKVNITPDDVIFNFAAVHRTPGHPDPAYFETNIRGAENVCAFAERHGIRKIVFTSSIAPYGAAEELKEEPRCLCPTPHTAYPSWLRKRFIRPGRQEVKAASLPLSVPVWCSDGERTETLRVCIGAFGGINLCTRDARIPSRPVSM